MFQNLFNPDAQKDKAKERQACNRVKGMVLEMIPEELKEGLHVNVLQMSCTDPGCAPIDTIVHLTWQQGLSKPVRVGLEAREVDYPDLQQALPPVEIITSWAQGDAATSSELRFANGTRVKCRVGADPITGWAPGRIKQLWYREDAWPSGTFAPYQVQLDDGRLIFAPRDEDSILMLNYDAAPGSGGGGAAAEGGDVGGKAEGGQGSMGASGEMVLEDPANEIEMETETTDH